MEHKGEKEQPGKNNYNSMNCKISPPCFILFMLNFFLYLENWWKKNFPAVDQRWMNVQGRKNCINNSCFCACMQVSELKKGGNFFSSFHCCLHHHSPGIVDGSSGQFSAANSFSRHLFFGLMLEQVWWGYWECLCCGAFGMWKGAVGIFMVIWLEVRYYLKH